ncbi:type II secretion system F family protein [Streptomyces sp. DH12]|uniref:type II secretion system F family protein n=1 Tax=Streptomyces sp. DH12 TaxID=2857010 RepID=UPI001E2A15F9|nr:type II secretion system F family protein [Streptomyces sp. DH12]
MNADTAEVVHRLWTVATLLGSALCAAWVTARARRAVRACRRLTALGGTRPERPPARWRGGRARLACAPWTTPAAALSAGWLLIGGTAGCLIGAAAAYGVHRWQRRPRPDTGDTEAARRLPPAAELLAACLSAGAGPREAAEAVGRSMGGPLGERLGRTAAELALGGDPGEAWGRFGDVPGARPLARCLERAAATGAPAAGPVTRLAAGLRADQARAAAARAQRTQVLITAPVGLCFLPAFLAVGVAPVVIGLAGRLL